MKGYEYYVVYETMKKGEGIIGKGATAVGFKKRIESMEDIGEIGTRILEEIVGGIVKDEEELKKMNVLIVNYKLLKEIEYGE